MTEDSSKPINLDMINPFDDGLDHPFHNEERNANLANFAKALHKYVVEHDEASGDARAISNPITEDDILKYLHDEIDPIHEWMLAENQKQEEAKKHGLEYVVGAIPGQRAAGALFRRVGSVFKREAQARGQDISAAGAAMAAVAINEMLGGLGNMVSGVVDKTISGARTKAQERMRRVRRTGSPASPGGGTPRNRDFDSRYALTSNLPPFETSFKPDVTNFTRGEFVLDKVSTGPTESTTGAIIQANGRRDVWSCLQLQGGVLQIPHVEEQYGNEWWRRIIVPAMTYKGQLAFRYSLQPNEAWWQQDNLIHYFNRFWHLIQIYYFFDSIISYNAEPSNQNLGMRNLYDSLSTTDLKTIEEARRYIADNAIPPNFNQAAFEFYANQKENAFANGVMIKFVPFGTKLANVTSGAIDLQPGMTLMKEIIDELNSDATMMKIKANMAALYPPAYRNVIYSYSAMSRFDLDYGNAWSAYPFARKNNSDPTQTEYYPSAGNTDTIFVQSKTEQNRNDGALCLALGINVSGTRRMGWSQPKLLANTNRVYWAGETSLFKCVTAQGDTESVGDGYNLFDCSYWGNGITNGNIVKTLPRADTLRNVRVEAFPEITSQLLDLFMDIGSMGELKDNKVYSSPVRSQLPNSNVRRFGKKGRKGKKKMSDEESD